MRRRNPSSSLSAQPLDPGDLIEVYWSGDRRYYKGKVASFDHTTNTHRVEYVDGDVENLDLTTERWRSAQDNSKPSRTRSDQAKKKRVEDDGEESNGDPDDDREDASVTAGDQSSPNFGDREEKKSEGIADKSEKEPANVKLKSKRKMKSQSRLSADSIPNSTRDISQQQPSTPSSVQTSHHPVSTDPRNTATESAPSVKGPTATVIAAPIPSKPVLNSVKAGVGWSKTNRAARKAVPMTIMYKIDPAGPSTTKGQASNTNLIPIESKSTPKTLKAGSHSLKVSVSRSKSFARKSSMSNEKASNLKKKIVDTSSREIAAGALPSSLASSAPDAVSSASVHATDVPDTSKMDLENVKTKSLVRRTSAGTLVTTQIATASPLLEATPVLQLPSSFTPGTTLDISLNNQTQRGAGHTTKSGQTAGKSNVNASKGRKRAQSKTTRKFSANGNPKPSGSSSSSAAPQPQSGAVKRSRSPASSSEPKRPRKDSHPVIVNNVDVQTGRMAKLAIEATLQAMASVTKPLEQRIINTERCNSEIAKSNAGVASSITAFTKRQDSIIANCTQNKKTLEELRQSVEPSLKMEAVIKEDLKEYFAAHERRTRADNEALARRIRAIETEMKKADVPPSADPRNLRDTLMTEVRNLRADFLEEMKKLSRTVDERVASTADSSATKFLTSSMPASLKDAIQEQSIKTATEAVRTLICKEIPLAIEKTVLPRIEALLQAPGINKISLGARHFAVAPTAPPSSAVQTASKSILIPRSAPRGGDVALNKVPAPTKSTSPVKTISKSVASKGTRARKPTTLATTFSSGIAHESKAASSGIGGQQAGSNGVGHGAGKQIETIIAEGGPRVRAQTAGSTVSTSTGAERIMRAKSLVGRSATIWLLEDTERSAPPVEPAKRSSWARECCTQCFKHVARTLRTFSSDGEAMRLLNASLSLEHVELTWFLNPGDLNAVNRARANYQSWDPPLCNDEWNAEASVLRELSRRFSLAEARVKPTSNPSALQVAVSLTSAAAELEK